MNLFSTFCNVDVLSSPESGFGQSLSTGLFIFLVKPAPFVNLI